MHTLDLGGGSDATNGRISPEANLGGKLLARVPTLVRLRASPGHENDLVV
jgi:hypothetical protein